MFKELSPTLYFDTPKDADGSLSGKSTQRLQSEIPTQPMKRLNPSLPIPPRPDLNNIIRPLHILDALYNQATQELMDSALARRVVNQEIDGSLGNSPPPNNELPTAKIAKYRLKNLLSQDRESIKNAPKQPSLEDFAAQQNIPAALRQLMSDLPYPAREQVMEALSPNANRLKSELTVAGNIIADAETARQKLESVMFRHEGDKKIRKVIGSSPMGGILGDTTIVVRSIGMEVYTDKSITFANQGSNPDKIISWSDIASGSVRISIISNPLRTIAQSVGRLFGRKVDPKATMTITDYRQTGSQGEPTIHRVYGVVNPESTLHTLQASSIPLAQEPSARQTISNIVMLQSAINYNQIPSIINPPEE